MMYRDMNRDTATDTSTWTACATTRLNCGTACFATAHLNYDIWRLILSSAAQ